MLQAALAPISTPPFQRFIWGLCGTTRHPFRNAHTHLCRVLLMEQDVSHRIGAPSSVAAGPRYSLVWKLVLLPKQGTQAAGQATGQRQEQQQFLSLSRPQWGAPQRFGSASSIGAAGVAAL